MCGFIHELMELCAIGELAVVEYLPVDSPHHRGVVVETQVVRFPRHEFRRLVEFFPQIPVLLPVQEARQEKCLERERVGFRRERPPSVPHHGLEIPRQVAVDRVMSPGLVLRVVLRETHQRGIVESRGVVDQAELPSGQFPRFLRDVYGVVQNFGGN